VLLVFRALQGCAVTGFLTNGNAVVADIFVPEKRGAAAGIFMVPHVSHAGAARRMPCCHCDAWHNLSECT
jgi:MFS family permease